MSSTEDHERSLAQYDELLNVKAIFLKYQSVLAGIDHAIANFFDPQTHNEVGNCLAKVKDLTRVVKKMEV